MDRTFALGALLAASLTALPVCAQDGAPGRSRVKITGSGSNVVLERQAAPQRSERKVQAAPESAPGPIDSAAELKASGASDASVIAFLRTRDDLPSVIAAGDVRKLRKAGAGQSVIGWLATVTAFDIGETGEGHEAVYPEPSYPVDYGAQVYDAGYPVPYFFGNGYYPAGGYAPSRLPRFGRSGHPGGHLGGHPGSPGRHSGGHVARSTPLATSSRIVGVPARRLLP